MKTSCGDDEAAVGSQHTVSGDRRLALHRIESHRSHAGEALPSQMAHEHDGSHQHPLTGPGARVFGRRRPSALCTRCDPGNSEQCAACGRDRSELHCRIFERKGLIHVKLQNMRLTKVVLRVQSLLLQRKCAGAEIRLFQFDVDIPNR